jgi:Subtilase family/Fervidolysin N-terminal prodomain
MSGCLSRWFRVWLLLALLSGARAALCANTLQWHSERNQITADIRNGALSSVLEHIAAATGWKVYVEPGASHKVSARFKDLPQGQALRLLLGDLNFALVPNTNSAWSLFVFRTSLASATQLVSPHKRAGNRIPNELVVVLKPGANIDDLARLLGAKVIGRIGKLNAYRLQFKDEFAADAARAKLASNPDVALADNNYSIGAPVSPGALQPGELPPPPQLQLKPPNDKGRIIIGLIDTGVQSLGGNLDSFLLKPLSVAGPAQLDPSTPSHGTAMAETILRSIQDMTQGNTSVQILPVDIYGPNPSTSTFDVANGIIQAVNAGANVLNLSLGSEADSPFLHDVIKQVSQDNIPIFAAAGNQPVTTPMYPAAYPEVMAVTALNGGQIADYANRGSFVSLGAPGTSVVYYDNQPYYAVGTSTATAFTSGIAAGFMDATHNNTRQMENFIKSNFGLQNLPASH